MKQEWEQVSVPGEPRRDKVSSVEPMPSTWAHVLDAVSDAIVGLDADAHLTYVNRIAEHLLALPSAELLGSSLWDVLLLQGANQAHDLAALLKPALSSCHRIRMNTDLTLCRRDGVPLAVECLFLPILGGAGQQLGRFLILRDKTDSHQWSHQLRLATTQDSLTGLVSRREFEQRLQQAVALCQQQDLSHVVCYIDLDQFKVVNDTCGHEVGDALLQRVGQSLRTLIRQRDTLARLGGDEFAILLWQCPQDAGRRVGEQILKTLESLRFTWGEHRFQVTASVGLVVLNREILTAAEALSLADSACYVAKDTGRNRMHMAGRDDQTLQRRHDEMQWVSRLTQALEQDALQLYQQTIAPLQIDDEGMHYEVLVRLRGEDGVIYPPGAFMPAAERYGLMVQLDRWVINHTLAWLGRHPEHLAKLTLCTINLSGASINQPETLHFIAACFEQNAVPAHKVGFEVTETMAINNLSLARQLITGLQALGCVTALDDFGAGMSSLAYLRALPVDILKIDGSFVRNMARDPMDYALVKAMHDIGHMTGKITVAEFCEDADTYRALQDLGVDFVQGYHIAHPAPLETIPLV